MTVTRAATGTDYDELPNSNGARPASAGGWLTSGLTLAGPLVIVYVVTVLFSMGSGSMQIQTAYALADLVIVVGLQLFVGNSGVLSFGHISFAAVGAWTMGLLTIDPTVKRAVLPQLFPWLSSASASPAVALILGAVFGGVLAFIVAPFLMRLNGLQAGIATFALLGVVVQVLSYWTKIGPPSGQSMVGVPHAFSLQVQLFLALAVIVVSWLYGRTRTARLLRAARENPVAAPGSGINITVHRVLAFGISGVLCGIGGAMWAQTNTVVQASQLSTGFTFTVIAMLVLGGTMSLWGAVLGTLVYSVVDALLQQLQSGLSLGSMVVTIPDGSRPLILGALLILMLLFRPDGITRGREFGIPFLRRRTRARSSATPTGRAA